MRNSKSLADQPFPASLEPLEGRVLFSWTGATSGTTVDAAHDYNNLANWAGGVIDDSFAGVSLTANTTLYLSSNRTTTASGLNLGYNNDFDLTILSNSSTTRTLTLAGDVIGDFGGSASARTVTLGNTTNPIALNFGATGRTLTVSGSTDSLVLSNTVTGGGTTGLYKAGPGTLSLLGTNNYSGGTTLHEGKVSFTSGGLNTTGNITFDGTSTLNWNATNLDLSARIQPIPLNVTATLQTGTNTVAFAYPIAGQGNIIKWGSNSLTLAAANALPTGTVWINNGSLKLTNADALKQTTLELNAGTGTLGFETLTEANLGGLQGTGNLSLTNASSAPVTLRAGYNGLSTTYSGQLSGSGSFAKRGTGTLVLTQANTYTGSTSITGGTLDFVSGGLGTGSISVGAGTTPTLRWASGNTQDVSPRLQAIPTAVTLTFNTNGNNVILASPISGTGGAVAKAGDGMLSLTAANTYDGGTTLNGGTLDFVYGALGTGSVTFANDAALRWRGTNTQDISAQLRLPYAGVTATLNTVANNVAFGTGLTGIGNILKTGTGILTLNAAGTLTGTTRIGAGALTLGNRLALQSSTVDLNAADAGVLSFGTGLTPKLGGLTGTRGLSLLNDSLAPVTLQIGNNNQDTEYSGQLSGIGSNLNKQGTGTLTLTGSNIYTGTTTLASGTLQVGTGGTNGTLGTGPVVNGGSLIINRSGAITVGGAISGTGSLTQQGTGTLTLSGSSTYTGPTNVTAGTLVVNGSLASAVSVADGATLTGTGTAASSVTLVSGGTVQPTAGLGVLHVGNLVLPTGSTLAFTLNGNTLSTQYGQISVTGTVNLTGSTLSLSGTRTNDDGNDLVLIANDGSDAVVGAFAGLAPGAIVTVNGVAYAIRYNGGDGNDVVLTDLNLSVGITGPDTANEGQQLDFTSSVANTPDSITYGWSVNKDSSPLTLPAGSVTNQSGLAFVPPDDGSYDVIVQVWDQHGHAASATHPLLVADVPPSVDLAGNASVYEGQAYALQLAAIVDPGGDKVTKYRVNWGDHTSDIYDSADVTANGRYLTHVYADEAYENKTITVDLMDEDGPAETGGWHIARGTLVVLVNNAPPTGTLANDGPADQYSPITISFADPSDSPGDLAAGLHYTYALDPVDLANTYAAATDGTSKTFTLGDAGTHTVYGRVFDQGGAYTDYTTSVTVNSVQPEVIITGAPWNVLPGTPITLGSDVTYNGNPRTAGISYAWTITRDGNAYLADTGATVTFTPQDLGAYDISLTITDGSGQVASTWGYFDVAPFTATLSGAGTVTAGQPYTLSLATAGPGAASVTSWTIDWGDGSDEQVVAGSPSTVTHAFNAGAIDTFIYAWATDGTSTVYATPVPLTVVPDWSTLSVTGSSSVAAGGTYTLSLTATYPQGSTGAISQWSIDWGDGVFGAPDIQIVSGNTTTVTHIFAPGVGHAEIIATATDATGDYDADPILVTITGVSAPTAPTNVAVSPWSSTELDISWTGSVSTLSYNICRSDDGGATWALLDTVDGDQTSYADAGLASETAYAYQVTASNDGGTSAAGTPAPGGSASASTSSGKPALTVGTIVPPTAGGTAGSVTLSWSDTDQNVTGFELEQKMDGLGGNFQLVPPPDGNSNARSQTITGLLAGQTYEFRLRADLADGTVSDYTPAQSVTIPPAGDSTATLPAPTNVSATANSDGGFTVSFSWSYGGITLGTTYGSGMDTTVYNALVTLVRTDDPFGVLENPSWPFTWFPPSGGNYTINIPGDYLTYSGESFVPQVSIFTMPGPVGWSQTVAGPAFTFPGDPVPAVTLSANTLANGNVQLDWTAPADPGTSQVHIFCLHNGVANWVGSFSGNSTTVPASAGDKYFAVVEESHLDTNYTLSAYSNLVDGSGVAPAVPAAPNNLRATWDSTDANKVNLAWNDMADNDTGYSIWRATQEDFSDAQEVGTTGVDGDTYTDSVPDALETYYYRVYVAGGEQPSGQNMSFSMATPDAIGNLATSANQLSNLPPTTQGSNQAAVQRGVWDVQRKGGPTAIAVAGANDTIEMLAQEIGLDATTYREWLQFDVANPLPRSATEKLPQGRTYRIPNTVLSYWAGELGGFGKTHVGYGHDHETLSARGFDVVLGSGWTAGKFNQYLKRASKAKELQGLFFWGHGFTEIDSVTNHEILDPATHEPQYFGILTDSGHKADPAYYSYYADWSMSYKPGLGILFACGTEYAASHFSSNGIFWGNHGILNPILPWHEFAPSVAVLVPPGAEDTIR